MSANTFQYEHALADWHIEDPGNGGKIPTAYSGVCDLVSAAAETRTLARPSYIGQWMLLNFQTDGGNCVVTVTGGVNQTGNNTITFADAKESIRLEAVRESASLLRWQAFSVQPESEAPALSTV